VVVTPVQWTLTSFSFQLFDCFGLLLELQVQTLYHDVIMWLFPDSAPAAWSILDREYFCHDVIMWLFPDSEDLS
jgi:hypothetical protein